MSLSNTDLLSTIQKFKNLSKEDKLNMVYQWVKSNHIDLKQFKLLIDII